MIKRSPSAEWKKSRSRSSLREVGMAGNGIRSHIEKHTHELLITVQWSETTSIKDNVQADNIHITRIVRHLDAVFQSRPQSLCQLLWLTENHNDMQMSRTQLYRPV